MKRVKKKSKDRNLKVKKNKKKGTKVSKVRHKKSLKFKLNQLNSTQLESKVIMSAIKLLSYLSLLFNIIG